MTVVENEGIWRKASYSSQTDNCVEVALGTAVRVRDTKDRDGGLLAVDMASWSAFVAGMK